MIILQGRQGYGKSAFLKALAVKPEWYGSIGAAHMGGTDAKKLLGEDAAGKIILEYEELDGIRQTTAEKLKATITRTDDQYRQAYSVLSEMHPRQYVFAGTTNNGQYLSDPTGNRRFLPIPITKKGFLTPETVNQVWAEAFTLYKQGNFKLYLDDDVETIAETYRDNATRLISDDFTETIESFLNCRTPNGTPIQETTVKTIYQALCDDPLGKMKYNDAQKIIITALNMLQWTNKQVKINGKNCRRYVRPQGDT
jgi:predicted P-loop ATPase